ncbi:MAG: cytochrome P450 [Myxococcota bacterium]
MSSSEAAPNFEQIDFFTSDAFVRDPFPYYEFVRSQGPAWREPHHGVVMVTGYEEASEVLRDVERYSSCNAVSGPFPGFPVPLEGNDISALIEKHRDELPMNDQLPTLDPPNHTKQRALLMRLLTPNRLKENEEFMWRLADQQIDEFLASGRCEFLADYAQPFAMLVIADLLGVPEADREDFRAQLTSGGNIGATSKKSMKRSPLEYLYKRFSEYVEDRRQNPQDDVLTSMAQVTFPDGSLPEVIDVVRVAANLFAAGQETTVRLLGAGLQILGEDGALQARLREDSSKVPNFIEEALRCESPIKGDFRLTRVPTQIGGVEVPAGSTVMVLIGAANRDPGHFERAAEFDIDRKNARHHIAFGLGVHSCPGGPLARTETRISLERLLARLGDIRINEAEHGPASDRRYAYAPTFVLRGLQQLHLEFDGR